jgi:hypothetical protein
MKFEIEKGHFIANPEREEVEIKDLVLDLKEYNNIKNARFNGKQSVSIDTYCYDTEKENAFQSIVEYSQNIEFATDRDLKGKLVVMTLSGNPIDAPNIEIYFKQKDLKKILEFLIEQDK